MRNLSSPIYGRGLVSVCAAGACLFAAAAVAKDDGNKTAEKPRQIKQLADGSVNLPARDAVVHGTKLRYESDKSTLGYWFNADDWASWEFEITKPGKLFVDLTQSCGPDSAGSHYTVEVGDQKLKDKVQETGSFRLFRIRRLGAVEFEKPGVYTLSVRVQDKPGAAVMDLRAIKLSPTKAEKPATPALPAIRP